MMRFNFFLMAVILLFCLSSVSAKLYAQVIFFCEEVDQKGYPENESSSFTMKNSGSWLKLLVRLDDKVDCDEVKYVIYRVLRNGNEKYDTTIYQEVDKDSVWFWKEVTFSDNGKYNIYVYDKYDHFLTSGSLKINYQ